MEQRRRYDYTTRRAMRRWLVEREGPRVVCYIHPVFSYALCVLSVYLCRYLFSWYAFSSLYVLDVFPSLCRIVLIDFTFV